MKITLIILTGAGLSAVAILMVVTAAMKQIQPILVALQVPL